MNNNLMTQPKNTLISSKDYKMGPFISFLVTISWAIHLLYILQTDLNLPQIILHILIQTFLSTGLFITAHDSMHGIAAYRNPRLNKNIGQICLLLYGGFFYKKLYEAHHSHHNLPTSSSDPDYTTDSKERFHIWLFQFAKKYYGLQEFVIMHIHVGLVWFIGGAVWKIFAFYAIPAWASAIQLFYFGTYLPHRKNLDLPHSNMHFARSNNMPTWLSFITCYHFGYHLEHHENPQAPWWTLPKFKKHSLQK